MLMAHEKGAALIVSVGAHFNLIEFLDRKRGGMSSTFLTRLDRRAPGRRQGREPALQPGLDAGAAGLLPVAFLVLLTILVITSPALNDVFELIWLKVRIWLGID